MTEVMVPRCPLPHHRDMANLKASINFGLVHIPVEIVTAEDPKESVSFNLLDSKDNARIRYKRVNENTGKEVEWEDIVKGYEVEKDEYVTFTDEELKELAVESNKSIEIEGFVDRHEIPPSYFETPYYLIPGKGGEKGYAVLEKVLAKAKKFAVVQAVLRNKEHLGVVYPEENALVLGLIRYENELKKVEDVVPSSTAKVKITDKEISMAERLMKEMSGPFKPRQFKDRYAEKVHEAVEEKMKGGKPKKSKKKDKAPSKSVDIMDLLSRSLKEKDRRPASRKRAA